jgi:hypothetical protein
LKCQAANGNGFALPFVGMGKCRLGRLRQSAKGSLGNPVLAVPA